MKKSLILVLTAVVLMTTGCHMLDEEAYGQPTAEELLSNPENVSMVVGQAYSEVKWLHDHCG